MVLTRRSNESVVVGPAKSLDRVLTVTVIEIGDGKVRLGFEAADDVPVHRLEIWERIHGRAVSGTRKGGPEGPLVKRANDPFFRKEAI